MADKISLYMATHLSSKNYFWRCSRQVLLVILLAGTLAWQSPKTAFADADDLMIGAPQLYMNTTTMGNLNFQTDTVDWKYVSVSGVGTLTFTLNVPTGKDFDLEIYNANGVYLKGSRSAGGFEEVSLNINGSARYYAKIFTGGLGTGTYSYSIVCTLTANKSPSLSNGYVSPPYGGIFTTFTFYVTYKDPDGDKPSLATVQIDGSGGSYQHNMSYVSGSYSSGAVYKYETFLPIANHSFYFIFDDGNSHRVSTNTVSGPSVTNQPPNVDISYPGSNQTVSGTVTILVSAYDPESGRVQKIEYFIDGAKVYTDTYPKNQSPASQWTWNTKSYPDGNHTIKVIAYDGELNSASDSVTVAVRNNNPPTLANGYVTPASGGRSTQFTYYVTYADPDGDPPNAGSVGIETGVTRNYYPMTYVSGSYTQGALYRYQTTLAAGNYKFIFSFTDGKGGTATSALFSGPTVIDNPITITFVQPAANSTVAGNVVIETTVKDTDDPVKKVEYYIDSSSAPVYTATNSSTTSNTLQSKYTWNTTGLMNQSKHNIIVKAYNARNEYKTETISVIVDNKDHIKVSHSPEPVVKNQAVTFSGTIVSGLKSGRTVYVYSQEAGVSTSVTADLQGNFVYKWTPANPGTYYFRFGFVQNMTTSGDCLNVVSVFPSINNITQVTFSPNSISSAKQNSPVNVSVKVSASVGSPGVLQTLITGNGVSQEQWIYLSTSQSLTKTFSFTITTPAKSGTFTYSVYTQFRPNVSSGPINSTELYDTFVIDAYTISTTKTQLSTSISLPNGYSTFALPFDLGNKTFSSAFANKIPRYISTWNNSTLSYQVYPDTDGYDTFSYVVPGKGHLVYSDSARELSFTGTPAPSIKIALTQGWNFFSQYTGTDNILASAVIVNQNGQSYSLNRAVKAGIVTDGIYELKNRTWQLAKFLKLGRGYYIYVNAPAELLITAFDGPNLTSLSKNTFSGYLPAQGDLPIRIAVPPGTSQIKMNISGAGAGQANMYLYNPSGVLAASKENSAVKEIVIPNPAAGNWRMITHSTALDDTAIAGNVNISHPKGGQYAMLAARSGPDFATTWDQCVYGSIGYGDKNGFAGMTCDVGPNLLGVVLNPGTAIADQFVDIYQISGTCIAPVIDLLVSDESEFFWGDYLSRCGPNAAAFLLPVAGDYFQISTKAVKYFDNLVAAAKNKALKVFAKTGVTSSNLPSYLKLLNEKKLEDIRMVFKKPTAEELLDMGMNENQWKGYAAEKMSKMIDDQLTTAQSIIKPGTTDIQKALRDGHFQKNIYINGQPRTIGIGSYDPVTQAIPSKKIIVKWGNGVKDIGVGTDRVILHDGKMYIKEVKSLGSEQAWRDEFIVSGKLDNLKALRQTLDSEFKELDAEIVVQSFDVNPPSDLMTQFKNAGIYVTRME